MSWLIRGQGMNDCRWRDAGEPGYATVVLRKLRRETAIMEFLLCLLPTCSWPGSRGSC
jgi:hypothetical protein